MREKLKTMDAETLMNTPLPPLRFIVNDFLPQGLHILAGAPKIGKSWMSLWLALQISKGEPVWSFDSERCEVLYLCLEDSFSRIQNRLFKLTDDAPPSLHFAIMSGRIGDGLELQIETFLAEHEGTRLIIIDTMQKVRSKDNQCANLYERDYDDISVLKSIADKHKLAILLIHHLRKTLDSDPVNMISGSSGISGSADTNFILQKKKRSETTAKLICVGRDIEQREIYLSFNKETFLWETVMPIEKEEPKIPNEIIFLCHFLQTELSFTGTATELAEKLNTTFASDFNPAALKKKIIGHMTKLSENGITYADKRTYERREFSLVYDGMTAMTVKLDMPPCENMLSLPSVPSGGVLLCLPTPCAPVETT